MDDCIKRSAAIAATCEYCSENGVCRGGHCADTDAIRAITAEKVRPAVYARWIECGNDQPRSADKVYCCSNCGGSRRFEWQLKPFCEECGAVMGDVKNGL